MSRPFTLTEAQQREVAHLAWSGTPSSELAERFGVSERTIARVVARERDWVRGRGLDGILRRLERET